MNEVAAAPYVLHLSLQLYMHFRDLSIYRVLKFCRRECYGSNVFLCHKLSYYCSRSSACMFDLTEMTVIIMINFRFSISRFDYKNWFSNDLECMMVRHEITLGHVTCCGVIYVMYRESGSCFYAFDAIS